MIQTIFTILAAACWAVMSHLIFHNKNDGPFKRYRFFGKDSWVRKYKRAPSRQGLVSAYDFYPPPDHWYYRFFGITHQEKFPWSATALAFVTDGVHLFQWLTTKFIFLAVTISYDHGFHFDWPLFLAVWIGWSFGFNVVFTRLNRKKK